MLWLHCTTWCAGGEIGLLEQLGFERRHCQGGVLMQARLEQGAHVPGAISAVVGGCLVAGLIIGEADGEIVSASSSAQE
jgi:hypothetical protein